jgi:hypothetical protein
MSHGKKVPAMKAKRRWLGLRIWVVDAEGNRGNATVWWEDQFSILVREHGVVGLQTLPRSAEGTRWGFADDKTP